ncbi:hypothetical protein QJS10_CPA16g00700 [Acorus calamus]|uniref:Uncharacterized protein n=1 Tax=Acorus calamus TaxID=4465 RepID=A0AAV9D0L3_ACOCL|nr:hypothetical protein QJS10_CPA16g00700 [Acorus calamus]
MLRTSPSLRSPTVASLRSPSGIASDNPLPKLQKPLDLNALPLLEVKSEEGTSGVIAELYKSSKGEKAREVRYRWLGVGYRL